MENNKIKIRNVRSSDLQSLFKWRNDKLTRKMAFQSEMISLDKHLRWFNQILSNKKTKLYIGEIFSDKIGVCRFDTNIKNGTTEVSINLNPNYRGRSLGKRLLDSGITHFNKIHRNDLLARIKPKNKASLKIFKSLGFQEISSNADVITLVKCDKKIIFKEVDENDTEVLLKLLKQRFYSISNNKIPTKNEHNVFVKAHPYRYWAIILEDNCPIGTFYLQDDNSVGLNINEPSLYIVSNILTHLYVNFKPHKEIKSKVAPYFHINVSYSNKKLSKILLDLDARPFQISYRV